MASVCITFAHVVNICLSIEQTLPVFAARKSVNDRCNLGAMEDDGNHELDLAWGTVPAVIVDLARRLAHRAGEDAKRAERIKWPEQPGDVQTELRLAIGAAHKTTKAATDLRALLSAYAHKFHNPRPVISDLARAQDTSSQGFIRRYSEETVEAVTSLLSSDPNPEVILQAFPSVSLLDLVDLGGTVGAAAQSLRESGRFDAKRIRDGRLVPNDEAPASTPDEQNAQRRAREPKSHRNGQL